MTEASSSGGSTAGQKRARQDEVSEALSKEQPAATTEPENPAVTEDGDEDDEDDEAVIGTGAGDGSDDDNSDDSVSDKEGDAALEEDEAAALAADLGEDVREGKRIRRNEAIAQPSGKDSDSKKLALSEASESAWASLKGDSEDSKGEAGARNPGAAQPAEAMVHVVKTFRFGREEVTEEKMLPASHPDAKAFLAKQANKAAATQTTAPAAKEGASTAAGSSTGSRPPPPGPRRKKGGGLAAMSAAATAKPGKINTLEKSKMDWTRFKDSDLDEHTRHELDAQTKGGGSGLSSVKGYMDRRDFLDRVQNRLESDGKP